MKTLQLLTLFLFCGAVAAGCARVKRIVSPEAAPPAARKVALRIHAAQRLNTDSKGRPLALLIRIYKLRQSAAFEQAPADAFLSPDKEREALGADLIDVKEIVLVPGQRFEASESIGPEADFIGVAALFHSPAPQRARLAFRSAAAHKVGITIGAHGCALSVGTGAAPLNQGGAVRAPAHCQ